MKRFAVHRCSFNDRHAASLGFAIVAGRCINDASFEKRIAGFRLGVALGFVAIYFVLWGKEIE